jgi:hypothetical protein
MGWENWFGRFARGVRLDRNPLRRRSDRVETLVLAGSFAAAIAAAPFAAQAASHASYSAAQHARQAELATRHQVKAVLLEPAGGTANGYEIDTQVTARARWTSVTGVTRTGRVSAPVGTEKGEQVAVWTDTAGYLASPPLMDSQVAGQADLAAVAAVASIGILYLCETVVVRHVLTRRRMAAWDDDWAVTEPMWSHQRW